MTSFYLKGDALFARDVDIRRLARELRKRDERMASSQGAQPTTALHINHYLDEASALLGGKNHHAARNLARDPDISDWDYLSIQQYLWKEAESRGREFPKILPNRFNLAWQREAVALFAEADALRLRGKAEFVAIVGGTGAGKTLLANHVVHHRGGAVVDAGLTIQEGFQLVVYPGQVLVLDVPAVQPHPAQGTNNVRPKTLAEARMHFRRPYQFGGFVSALQSYQSWVIEHSQVTVAPTFGSRQAVEQLVMQDHGVFNGRGEALASGNWRRAHVVDLDTMTVYTIDGVGLAIEEGRHSFTIDKDGYRSTIA